MKRLGLVLFFTAASASALASSSLMRTIVWSSEPSNALAKWHYTDVTTGGVSRINDAEPDSIGGNGSLEQILPPNLAARTRAEVLAWDVDPDPVYGLFPSAGGFGLLSTLSEVSFEWQRSSASRAPGHFTPAFRVLVFDPDYGYRGATYELIWEGVYNGYGRTVPTDRWIHSNITTDKFWRTPLWLDGEWVGSKHCNINPSDCFDYSKGLHDWGLGPSTTIVGLNVSVGSGWTGDYHGFVDLVTLSFTNGARSVWDFEPVSEKN